EDAVALTSETAVGALAESDGMMPGAVVGVLDERVDVRLLPAAVMVRHHPRSRYGDRRGERRQDDRDDVSSEHHGRRLPNTVEVRAVEPGWMEARSGAVRHASCS